MAQYEGLTENRALNENDSIVQRHPDEDKVN